MRGAFKVLARLKGLRGTAFDPFGRTAERRMERDLIGWYEAIVDGLAEVVDRAPREELLWIARAPLDMRGYGPVKEEAVARLRPEVDRRWAAVRAGTTAPRELGRAA